MPVLQLRALIVVGKTVAWADLHPIFVFGTSVPMEGSRVNIELAQTAVLDIHCIASLQRVSSNDSHRIVCEFGDQEDDLPIGHGIFGVSTGRGFDVLRLLLRQSAASCGITMYSWVHLSIVLNLTSTATQIEVRTNATPTLCLR